MNCRAASRAVLGRVARRREQTLMPVSARREGERLPG